MLERTEYPSFQSELAAPDSIVLFTDGLFEAENPHGERFGRQRLMDAVRRRLEVPCERLLGELVQESQEFAGREDFIDDVCLVGMDVVKGGAKCEQAA
jgi:serine phosphatase RsbU (regulator of sigma subunit)